MLDRRRDRFAKLPRRPAVDELGSSQPELPRDGDLAPHVSTGGQTAYGIAGELTKLGNLASAARGREGVLGLAAKALALLLLLGVLGVIAVVMVGGWLQLGS